MVDVPGKASGQGRNVLTGENTASDRINGPSCRTVKEEAFTSLTPMTIMPSAHGPISGAFLSSVEHAD